MIQDPHVGDKAWAFSAGNHHRATEYFIKSVHSDYIIIERPHTRQSGYASHGSHRQVNRSEIFATLDGLIQDVRDYARGLPE